MFCRHTDNIYFSGVIFAVNLGNGVNRVQHLGPAFELNQCQNMPQNNRMRIRLIHPGFNLFAVHDKPIKGHFFSKQNIRTDTIFKRQGALDKHIDFFFIDALIDDNRHR